MSRRMRLTVFVVGAGGMVVMLAYAFLHVAAFGGSYHPYRDLAVPAAVSHATANVVSSINFDQRGLDTLGEESILLGSVLGVSALLRPGRDETERGQPPLGQVLESTRLLGYVFLPVTLIVGLDVIAHGHVTPGGGFQGGVVLGTGIHLLYVAGSYPALSRARPEGWYEAGEALGAGAFACLGLAGTIVAGTFLTNFLAHGRFGQLLSAGTVPILNGAVGIEVAASTVVLLAQFLTQDILVVGAQQDSRSSGDSP